MSIVNHYQCDLCDETYSNIAHVKSVIRKKTPPVSSRAEIRLSDSPAHTVKAHVCHKCINTIGQYYEGKKEPESEKSESEDYSLNP